MILNVFLNRFHREDNLSLESTNNQQEHTWPKNSGKTIVGHKPQNNNNNKDGYDAYMLFTVCQALIWALNHFLHLAEDETSCLCEPYSGKSI